MNPAKICIGLLNPKSPENVASVLRAAGNYRVNSVFYTGTRYPRAARLSPCTVDMSRKVSKDIAITGVEHLIDDGEHDFYSFARRDASISSTFRTIFSCEILQAQPSTFGNKIYYLKIVGNDFLKQMVRYIAGALFALGRNQLSLSDISEALVNHKEEKVSSRAKLRGLHLIQICY